jgi:hypothetical protein
MTWTEEILGTATLTPLPPRLDNNGQPYLPLVYRFPIGEGDSVSENSALVRPFKRVLEKGKPMGTIGYIFYQEAKAYFVLGALAYSENGRILFFPGGIDRRVTLSPDGKEILGKGILHNIDHLSLESNYRNYHVTLLEKGDDNARYSRLNTQRIKDDMFFWFAISFKDTSTLEPAPRTQEIRLRGHNLSDLKRRYSIIEKSRGDCIFNGIFVDDRPQEQYFINFEFFVSLRQSREYTPPQNVRHTGLAPITKFEDQRKMVMARVHPVLLKGFSGMLWVQASKIIGTHDSDSVFISYSPQMRTTQY